MSLSAKQIKPPAPTKADQKRQQLYQALLVSYQLYQPKDFLILRKDFFLKLCDIQELDFFTPLDWLNKEFKKVKSPSVWLFQFKTPLIFKGNDYGHICFYTSQKITKPKQSFLKKISSFITPAIYFISAKEQLASIKKQWLETFDSFPQAFCITDSQFKILHSNTAFQKLFQKNKHDLLGQKLFSSFPPFFKNSDIKKSPSSFILEGLHEKKKVHWEISSRKLYLQKEQMSVLLFLIKDISKEIQLSSKISTIRKEKEMGWIKGSLAHELNNPITGIKLLLSILEKEIHPHHPQFKKELLEMQKAMDSCHQVIQNFLSVSKQSPSMDREQIKPY